MADIYRRRLLSIALMGLASHIIKGCGSRRSVSEWPQARSRSPLLVDVHCHAFNASDLPIHGFVQRVVLGDEENQVVLGPESRAILPWLGALLVELLGAGAKTAADELSEMEQARRYTMRPRPANPADDTETVARSLQAVLGDAPALRRLLRPSDLPRDSAGRDALLRRIAHDAGIDPSRLDLRTPSEARDVARGLLSGGNGVSLYIRWAQEITRDRREIISHLIELYSPAAELAVFTPALIDFSSWLDGEPLSNMESQIRVMERIQRQQQSAVVHCFAPFDPWRQVLDVEVGMRPTALELAQWAVEDMGFIGIKVYPPMGFLPMGNALIKQTYPERASDIRDFPSKLDGALATLYAYAEREGVPIMAHATNSNGAATGYAGRAHPQNWMAVLKAYPRLRLNLGHFGDFEEAIGRDGAETWELVIGRMISTPSGSVYADLSYLAELLPSRDPVVAAHIRRHLTEFIQRYDASLGHLMYGSDWIMLGLEAEHPKYVEAIRAEMQRILGERARLNNFLGGNALRYLGLRQGEPGRRRLEAYYARHRKDATWLTWIDRFI